MQGNIITTIKIAAEFDLYLGCRIAESKDTENVKFTVPVPEINVQMELLIRLGE